MRKKPSLYADVLFPQNINNLTYGIPARFMDEICEGMLVKAPLRGKEQPGFVGRIHSDLPHSVRQDKLKEIASIEPLFVYPRKLFSLLEWVSDYYMSSEGLALKSLLFTQILQSLKRPRKIKPVDVPSCQMNIGSYKGLMDDISRAISQKTFRTFLFHSHSTDHDISLVMNIIRTFRNILVLVPEYQDIQRFLPFFHQEANGRYCLLHGSMSKTGIHDSYRGILSKQYDIVIGTMQTVFAPMQNPSIIIVLKEHSSFYKHEETPAYNVRDVAVKRASIEKIPVLLTSMAPSLESYFNYRKKKYTLLPDPVPAEYPRIRIINASGSPSILTSPLKKGIRQALEKKGKVLLILNRKGHSILKCGDCGSMEMCPKCNVPFVYHTERVLKCHYCGARKSVHDLCHECGGSFLKFATSGTEKVYEELENEFGSVVSMIDSEHIPDSNSVSSDIILGTELVFREIAHLPEFDLTVIMNSDIHLQRPDFRAYEKFFQQVVSLTEFNKKNSELLIQTFDWKNPFFETVRQLDYSLLFESELNKRKIFHYPPWYRIASLSLKQSDFRSKEPLKERIECEILGPLRKTTGTGGIEFLIKCRTDRRIQKCVRDASKEIAVDDKKLKIDIDPLVFS